MATLILLDLKQPSSTHKNVEKLIGKAMLATNP